MNNDLRGYQFMGGVDKPGSWTKHLPDSSEDVNVENLRWFFELMFERQEIWYKRNFLKLPPPWTNNPILRDYRFTNSYRELDRASQWLINNVFSQNDISVSDLVWRIMFFRFFNQQETFEHPEYKVDLPAYSDFDPQKTWEQVVTYRENVGNPYHSSYLMNLAFVKKPSDWNGRGLFKDEAYIKVAYVKMHKLIPKIVVTLKKAKSPEEICKVLQTMDACGSFQAHEFYIDFCYAARYWKKAIIKFTENDYTNVGPGASLGVRLIFPSLKPKEQIEGLYLLRALAKDMLQELGDFKYIHWSRQHNRYVVSMVGDIFLTNIEFWSCEFSKAFKMKIGEGKQRSKFIPKTK